jgi:alcohol dehydrogenase class IV
MAHPLGYRFDIPHGVVCALLLPYTMRYNLEYAQPKYARIAELLGQQTRDLDERGAAERAVEMVTGIISAIDIPASLSEFGAGEADLAKVTEESMPSGSLKHNPRPLSAQDVVTILSMAL